MWTMCKDGKHDLETLLDTSGGMSTHETTSQSAKWCRNCGAAVVDIEVDGRLMSHVIPMQFPKVLTSMVED